MGLEEQLTRDFGADFWPYERTTSPRHGGTTTNNNEGLFVIAAAAMRFPRISVVPIAKVRTTLASTLPRLAKLIPHQYLNLKTNVQPAPGTIVILASNAPVLAERVHV